MESDPHITFLLYFNSNLNFKYEYKTDVSDSDFYSDIYSIVFKVDIVKFIIYEWKFTTKFITNQSEIKSKYTYNNIQYRSELNYNG